MSPAIASNAPNPSAADCTNKRKNLLIAASRLPTSCASTMLASAMRRRSSSRETIALVIPSPRMVDAVNGGRLLHVLRGSETGGRLLHRELGRLLVPPGERDEDDGGYHRHDADPEVEQEGDQQEYRSPGRVEHGGRDRGRDDRADRVEVAHRLPRIRGFAGHHLLEDARREQRVEPLAGSHQELPANHRRGRRAPSSDNASASVTNSKVILPAVGTTRS